MKIKALALGTTIAVAALAGQQVLAYEAGDIIVRAGVANVSPNDDSSGLAVPALAMGEISGTGVEVDDDTQLGLTATYMLTSSIGIELLAATPFEHDITADLGGLGKVDAGSTKHLPPTLSVVWYPLSGNGSAIQPYVGAGLNYTVFFEEEVSSDLEAGLPAVVDALTAGAVDLYPGPVPMELKLDNSWGLAAQLGVDVALNENWQVNASVRWIDIDTEAEISSALGSTITIDDVEIDPYVYQLNIGYKF